MQSMLNTFGPLVARLFLGQIFLLAGIHKMMDWNGTSWYMNSKGLPLVPVLLVASIFVEAGGGLMLMTGFKARQAALALAAFLVPVTLIFHNFWALSDQAATLQMVMFQKNLAIIGGLLMVNVFGPGGYTVKRG